MNTLGFRRRRVPAALVVLAASAGDAFAYVGPGAGGGSGSSIGIASILLFVLAGAIGLCVLCGLIAAVVTGIQRLRLWARARQ